MPALASIREHGEYVYITSPVQLYEPEAQEIEQFAFAADLRSAAPNPNILWLRGQYVEADKPNRNADMWTAGELQIKALTPVLMPITVMHDLRSAVGTIADARLLTPAGDQVPRARIDTTLAVWGHRFPAVAEECRVNSQQGTLMQSMECLSPFYDCSVCGKLMRRTPKWQEEWRAHTVEHADVLSGDRSPARTLRNVTFTGSGLIFGTRGARGALDTAHLEVEELAAMHRKAHEGPAKRARRKNTVEIEDSKYEALVAAKSDGETKLAEVTAQLVERDRKIETLEAEKVKADEERAAEKLRADEAEEKARVSAMRDERLAAFGTGFRAKLDKLETTAKRVKDQAGSLSDEEWSARLDELEETLGVKRDAALDAAGEKEKESDTTAGLLFERSAVRDSALSTGGSVEVTADAGSGARQPSPERRASVIGGLARRRSPQDKEKAKA